jgi:Domain of unknown function (DUF4252)
MKRIALLVLLLAFGFTAQAQSKTTEALQKRFEGSLALYFYKNTLRMLNQQENKEFDQLIENIEKMKFLMVDKAQGGFDKKDYSKLISDYQDEAYEAIVTSRMDGRNFDVYLRDAKGSKAGTVVLVNDSSSLYVLDIVGTIDVSKVGALFSTIDNNTDIGKRIRSFTNQKEDSVGKKKKSKVD